MEDKKEINIDIDAQTALGHYANLALITHSSSEFVMDFIQMMPAMQKPRVNSRVIMTPEHAKRLLRALQDNVSRYEKQFGEIKLPENTFQVPPMGFGGEA